MSTSVVREPEGVVRPARPLFLRNVHRLRAVAIASVVVSHTWWVPRHTISDDAVRALRGWRAGLTLGCTLHLVIVAGLLLVHLGMRDGAWAWLRRRGGRVVLPFLVVTAGVLVGRHLVGGEVTSEDVLSSVLLGRAQQHLWYVPWVVPVLLASPLLVRLPEPWFTRLVLVASVLPLVVSRTGARITLAQYAYYVPAYLLGAWAARYPDRVAALVDRHRRRILVMVLATGVWLTVNGDASVTIGRTQLPDSVAYVNRVALTGLVLEWLRRWDDRPLPMLDAMAHHSYGIYLLHMTVLFSLVPWWRAAAARAPDALAVAATPVFAVFVLVATFAVTSLASRAMGPRASRWLIGV